MSAVPQSLALPQGLAAPWQRAGLALLGVVCGLLLLYGTSARDMLHTWLRSDTYAHGLLVPPLVLWLLWRQRQALARLQPRPAPVWLLLVALAGVAWLLGELAMVHALAQAALVAQLVLAVPTLLGEAVARSVAFPLAFLFFAVPVGDFLLPPLMDWTAEVTVFALRASGIPVLRAGNSFAIPSGNWSVVEACSGVRYLIASLMLGTLFAYLSYRTWQRRALFVAVALLVPVVANWMRAYLIVLLGHVSDNRIATGVDHVLYGWLFFGLVVGLMFWVGARWAEPQAPVPRTLFAAASSQAARSAPVWRCALALLLVAALAPLALWALQPGSAAGAGAGTGAGTGAGAGTELSGPAQAPTVQAPTVQAAPLALGPRWPLAAAQSGTTPFVPAYHAPSVVLQAHYGPPAQALGLFVALYRQQGRGHSLVGAGNALLASDDPAWGQEPGPRAQVPMGADGPPLELATTRLRPLQWVGATEPQALQVWQLYWVHGHTTASAWQAKAWSAWSRLRGLPDNAAVLLVYGRADPATLAAFWSDNFPRLQAWLLAQEAP